MWFLWTINQETTEICELKLKPATIFTIKTKPHRKKGLIWCRLFLHTKWIETFLSNRNNVGFQTESNKIKMFSIERTSSRTNAYGFVLISIHPTVKRKRNIIIYFFFYSLLLCNTVMAVYALYNKYRYTVAQRIWQISTRTTLFVCVFHSFFGLSKACRTYVQCTMYIRYLSEHKKKNGFFQYKLKITYFSKDPKKICNSFRKRKKHRYNSETTCNYCWAIENVVPRNKKEMKKKTCWKQHIIKTTLLFRDWLKLLSSRKKFYFSFLFVNSVLLFYSSFHLMSILNWIAQL